MTETIPSKLAPSASIPDWLFAEVAQYDLDLSPPPESVLDIGANIGAFALWAHNKWPQATIRCFEPVELNFETLTKNLKGLPCKIETDRKAIRGFYGSQDIFLGDVHTTCSFYRLGRQTPRVEMVPCIDAKDIPGAEFIKIDTEGCEVEILERLSLFHARALVVECHRREDEEKIKKLAFDRGQLLLHSISGHVMKFVRAQEKPAAEVGRSSGSASPFGGYATNPLYLLNADNPDRISEGELVELLRAWAFTRKPSAAPAPKPGEPPAAAAPSPTYRASYETVADTLGLKQAPHEPLASMRHIFIAICSHYSSFDVSFTRAMMRLVQEAPKVRITFGFNHDPSVERARNILTANFLETDGSHILFIDSDIIFDHRHIERISSHREGVVGGIYPIKSQEPIVRWCGNGTHQIGEQMAPVQAGGLQEVGCMGTGFLCIARPVLEKMAELHPELQYIQEMPPFRREIAFWQQGVRVVNGARRFLTEDWNFCFLWRQMGGKVFADTHVMLKHAGRAVWPLDLQQGNPFKGT